MIYAGCFSAIAPRISSQDVRALLSWERLSLHIQYVWQHKMCFSNDWQIPLFFERKLEELNDTQGHYLLAYRVYTLFLLLHSPFHCLDEALREAAQFFEEGRGVMREIALSCVRLYENFESTDFLQSILWGGCCMGLSMALLERFLSWERLDPALCDRKKRFLQAKFAVEQFAIKHLMSPSFASLLAPFFDREPHQIAAALQDPYRGATFVRYLSQTRSFSLLLRNINFDSYPALRSHFENSYYFSDPLFLFAFLLGRVLERRSYGYILICNFPSGDSHALFLSTNPLTFCDPNDYDGQMEPRVQRFINCYEWISSFGFRLCFAYSSSDYYLFEFLRPPRG